MLGTQIMNAEIEKAADAAVNPAQQAAPIQEVAAPKETEKVYKEAEQAAFLETYGWITFMQSGVRNLGLNAKEIESFLKGAKAAAEGKEAPQKLGEQVEDMQKFLQQKAAAYEKIHQEQMKITAEKNRKAGDEFMQALLKKNNKIKTTTSGLSYEIISEGDVNVKATEIDKACMSIDVLPTVYNLFGLNYDSRLLMGRDIFSEEEHIVILSDRSWITDKGKYNKIY